MTRSALVCIMLAAGVTAAAAASAPTQFPVTTEVPATATKAPPCLGNPDVIGTSRVITVDPTEHTRIGVMQYGETLPLRDKEVVLTFDDGPLPPYTNHILNTLAAQCVKATFFMVGRQARAYPAEVRRVYDAGHTVATHSQNHPFFFARLPFARAQAEIDDGIASVTAGLGDKLTPAPFFRFPGLGHSATVEAYLASRGIMTWSADFPADDWRHIGPNEIIRRALMRLDKYGKGVLLLHDIQPATALALPHLLAALKARGYRIVHVRPADATHPKTPTVASQWLMHRPTAIASLAPVPVPPFAAIKDLSKLNASYAFGADFGIRATRLSVRRDVSAIEWPFVTEPVIGLTPTKPATKRPRGFVTRLGVPPFAGPAAFPATPRAAGPGPRKVTHRPQRKPHGFNAARQPYPDPRSARLNRQLLEYDLDH